MDQSLLTNSLFSLGPFCMFFYDSRVRFMCVLLSGMVITNHDKAIIVNCNEIYGRTKSVDEHHEDFIIKGCLYPHRLFFGY